MINPHRKLFKIPSGEKNGGKDVKFMGLYWNFTGISHFGKMQQFPGTGRTQNIPNNGIVKKQVFSPEVGFSCVR